MWIIFVINLFRDHEISMKVDHRIRQSEIKDDFDLDRSGLPVFPGQRNSYIPLMCLKSVFIWLVSVTVLLWQRFQNSTNYTLLQAFTEARENEGGVDFWKGCLFGSWNKKLVWPFYQEKRKIGDLWVKIGMWCPFCIFSKLKGQLAIPSPLPWYSRACIYLVPKSICQE